MLENASFQRLPAWSQAEILTKTGTLLAQRIHQDWDVRLYSLHHQFVELWVKDGMEITASFRQSASPIAILEPYMEDINLADLVDI